MMFPSLSLSQTNSLKGIAIIFMLMHHAFAFDYRIATPYKTIIDNWRVEEVIGWFGIICVPIFLFLSGYGLEKSSLKSLSTGRNTINRIAFFLITYWVVLLIFAPIGFLLNHYNPDFFKQSSGFAYWYNGTPRFMFSLKEFIMNFLTLSNSYNEEWWFVGLYLKLLLLFPSIHYITNNKPLFLIIYFLGYFVLMYYWPNDNVFKYSLPFILGILFSKIDFFERLGTIKILTKKIIIVGLILILTYSFYIAFKYSINQSNGFSLFIVFTIVPFWLFCAKQFIYLFKIKTGFLELLGINSTIMWLSHSFFCYYFFQNMLYSLKFSILIIIGLIGISLLCSLLLTPAIKKIQTHVSL